MDESLFRRNLEAFERHAPAWLAERLLEPPPAGLRLVGGPESGNLNLDLGHTLLYDGGAIPFARAQVEAFCADPKRILINPPALDSHWVKGEGAVYRAVTERFGPLPDPEAAPRDVAVGHLVSFGVGLGLHLPLLVERLAFRDLVLVEQFPDFLGMSARVLDWSALFAAVAARGGRVHFVIDGEPVNLANGAFRAMRGEQFGLVDGAFGLRHYASPVLDEARRLFDEMLPTLGSSLGFVEDECLMLENAVANLGRAGARLFPPGGVRTGSAPALVVGSGPSLDGSLEDVRRLAEGAVVIGAGTGTSALLEAGIVPDLHCEIENVPGIYDGLRLAADRHDLSRIPLLASLTVDPRIPPLFGPTAFFFRDSVTTSQLFAGPSDVLDRAGPTVANLACRAAAALGAPAIYLFGVDLGSTDPARHHSARSYYDWTDDPYWRSGAAMDALSIRVPGNLREAAYTNLAFLFTRSFFSAFCAAFSHVAVFNCSDGARIDGARPLPPASAVCPHRADARSVVREAFSALPAAGADEDERRATLAAYRTALDDWFDAVATVIAGGEKDWTAFYDALRPHLFAGGTQGVERAARACASGTLLLILQFGFACYRRLPSDRRAAFMGGFRGIASGHLEDMRRLVRGTLDRAMN